MALKSFSVSSNNELVDVEEILLRNGFFYDRRKNFYKNHPTLEHFIPLFIAFGSAFNKKGESFNSEMLYSNISMESFIFDEKEVEK